jgi:hypothetical protein
MWTFGGWRDHFLVFGFLFGMKLIVHRFPVIRINKTEAPCLCPLIEIWYPRGDAAAVALSDREKKGGAK